MADFKNIVVNPDLHARLKRLAIFEASTEGDFVSIGETIRRMADFYEKEKGIVINVTGDQDTDK